MRSLRLPVAPYHSTLTKMAGFTPLVTRLRRTSGVLPTAAAMEGSAAEYRDQTGVKLLAEPVAQRLDDRARLHEALAHRGHDLLRAGAVAVDADGLDLGVDELAGDGADLALHHHAHRLLRGLGGIRDEGVLAQLARDELGVVGVDPVGEALGGHLHAGHLARLGVVLGHGHGHEDEAWIQLLDAFRGGA